MAVREDDSPELITIKPDGTLRVKRATVRDYELQAKLTPFRNAILGDENMEIMISYSGSAKEGNAVIVINDGEACETHKKTGSAKRVQGWINETILDTLGE